MKWPAFARVVIHNRMDVMIHARHNILEPHIVGLFPLFPLCFPRFAIQWQRIDWAEPVGFVHMLGRFAQSKFMLVLRPLGLDIGSLLLKSRGIWIRSSPDVGNVRLQHIDCDQSLFKHITDFMQKYGIDAQPAGR